MDMNDVTSLGFVFFFFSVGSKVHQEFGVVSNGLAPNLGGGEFVMELLAFK